MEKKCFKCGETKPLEDYYKHPKMSDGRLNKCKSCTKADTKAVEEKIRSTPEGLAKDRERHREKYYKLGYKEKHKPTTEVKREAMTRYKEKYPEKHLAKIATQHLNRIPGLEYHHWSYNEDHYKDCIVLSTKEHAKLHRYIVYDQERMKYRRSDNMTLLDTKEAHLDYYASLHQMK